MQKDKQDNSLYLARKRIDGTTCYFIRESYPKDDHYCSRELFNLGTDPTRYIIYPGGNAFYIDEAVEDRLRDLGIKPGFEDLENIFWPFLDPDIQHAQEHFRGRGSSKKSESKAKPLSGDRFHLFDRRRVHFLRFGQMDQSGIGRVSPKLFKILCDKSRDELEQYFLASERILKPHEIKSYVYTIFDLQRHFSQSFSKTMPQGLDEDEVDRVFVQDVCRLHTDADFWSGTNMGDTLQDYLIRYAILFFDHDYGRSSYLDDMIQNWMNSRRDFRPPAPEKTVSVKEASTIFGVSETELKKMSRRELARIFRRKAQEIHPDTGGDHEAFIKLSAAYQSVRKRKK